MEKIHGSDESLNTSMMHYQQKVQTNKGEIHFSDLGSNHQILKELENCGMKWYLQMIDLLKIM